MFDLTPISEWLETNGKPAIISGPCSAETEEQVLKTAELLSQSGMVHALRAGIWKPRTRPDTFEGVGEIGLKWLQKAKANTGLKTAVEVANGKHVEAALNHDIDILWIGARTTVNPFSVQEIADALKGVDIPVMVKNPINPDLGLWIGAIERVHKSGTNKIAAIHRGFSQYSESKYRNVPQWEIPIELKRLIPQISLICDPSHIGGKRNMIEEISQKALDLNYSGLMIESHITPDEAWSDREQQVTPDTLVEIFASLTTRNSGVTDPLLEHNLEELREKIDAIDDNLLELLSTRMNVAEEIGRYKGQHNMTILQTERWNEILQRAMRKSTEKGLSKDFIQKYFNAIHQESINHQVTVMNEQKKSSKTEQNS